MMQHRFMVDAAIDWAHAGQPGWASVDGQLLWVWIPSAACWSVEAVGIVAICARRAPHNETKCPRISESPRRPPIGTMQPRAACSGTREGLKA